MKSELILGLATVFELWQNMNLLILGFCFDKQGSKQAGFWSRFMKRQRCRLTVGERVDLLQISNSTQRVCRKPTRKCQATSLYGDLVAAANNLPYLSCRLPRSFLLWFLLSAKARKSQKDVRSTKSRSRLIFSALGSFSYNFLYCGLRQIVVEGRAS